MKVVYQTSQGLSRSVPAIMERIPGVDVSAIAAILGHAKTTITLNAYVFEGKQEVVHILEERHGRRK